MRGYFILTAFLLILPAVSFAAGDDIVRGPLQLWDCVELAVRGNPRAKAELRRVSEAERSVSRAEAEFSPELRLYGHYNLNTYVPEISFPGRSIRLGDHDEAGLTLQADYLLYDWGRRRSVLDAERQRVESAGLSLGSARQDLAWRAGNAFLSMLGAANERRVAEQSVRTARAHLDDLDALHANGMLTYDQVLDGEVRLERARVLLRQTDNRVGLARADLLLSMGLSLESSPEFADSARGIPLPPPDGYSLESAINNRPDLSSFRTRAAELGLLSVAVEAGKKPDVRVFASGTAAKPGIDQFRNELIEYARAGMSISWTLGDGGRRDLDRSVLRARQEQVLAEAQVQAGRVALDLERARLQEQEVRDRLELSTRALRAAEESFRLVADRFGQGRATNTEFLDAEEQVTVSRLDRARAAIELELARWRLVWVSGRLYGEIISRWPDLESAAASVDSAN